MIRLARRSSEGVERMSGRHRDCLECPAKDGVSEQPHQMAEESWVRIKRERRATEKSVVACPVCQSASSLEQSRKPKDSRHPRE